MPRVAEDLRGTADLFGLRFKSKLLDSNANQGIGASVWWPLKDHPYDEPDEGMRISVTVPKDLMNVSNGQLKAVQEHETTKTWIWEVVNPINAYGVNISIGDYVHFEEIYQGENGLLKMDYYVLRP